MKLSVLSKITSHKLNAVLIAVLVLLLVGGLVLIPKILSKTAPPVKLEEVDLPFDPNGPYAILEPRRDGNAIVLNIKRVADYEKISYELAYQSQTTSTGDSEQGGEAIDRGVQGELKLSDNPKDRKSEYSQEILFGTCSKGDTSSTLHCVFDKGVENGTLVLRIQKDNKVYKMSTTWHLQKPALALGVVTSGDGHFTYTTKASRVDLTNVGFSLVNDLSGAPKLPDGKLFLGKVYAMNIPTAKTFPAGVVTIELVDKPTPDMKIARYNEGTSNWDQLDTQVQGSKLTTNAPSSGIFAVLKDAKN